MSFLCEKVPLPPPLEVYGAETLACIAIGDQNRPEGPGFFACSRPTAPKESLVCPQITRCNHSPNPPSSVRASYRMCTFYLKLALGSEPQRRWSVWNTCLRMNQAWGVVFATRPSSGVAPRACVRVYARRACAGAAESVHTYIHTTHSDSHTSGCR